MNKATVLAKMISRRYRVESLSRFWSDNTKGHGQAPTCQLVVGDLEHLLLHCPALQNIRTDLYQMWLNRSAAVPQLQCVILRILQASPSEQMQFVMDPISIPDILSVTQEYGRPALELVFYMTRTFAFNIHRKKQILSGNWQFTNYDCVSGTAVARSPTDLNNQQINPSYCSKNLLAPHTGPTGQMSENDCPSVAPSDCGPLNQPHCLGEQVL